MTDTSNLPQVDTAKLEEAFNGDLDLLLFYTHWVKNGLNAKEAYKELHPNVTDGSAEVLGSRLLSKVKREAVMAAYGLGHEAYYRQLRDGLEAMKRDQFSGEMYPDHTARKPYHDKLGKQLGIETESSNQINVQMNIGSLIDNTNGEN